MILAGGRGTRLRPITDTIPKAMVPFHGKPFMGHQVDMLREQGFDRVLMLLGYLPDVIIDHFGDGRDYGVDVAYEITAPDDLTAHRVREAQYLLDDTFLLLYCDNYWPMQMDRMWAQYQSAGLPAQITVYANDDGYTRDSVIVEDGRCIVFDRERTTPDLQGVEISYAILDRTTVVDLLPNHQELFEVAVYGPLADRGRLGAYWSAHRYYSVGGHRRLPLTEAFFARRPTVILDRDGTLNERPARAEYITHPDQLRWLPGALDALREFADHGWRTIVVTNQAGVARGALTPSDLQAVHERLRSDAAAAGGRIDAIYHCPHGWDEGCDCRKPAPGMLIQAQRDHHLDLTRTFFVGDDERDGRAADAAGCMFARVDAQQSLYDVAQRLLRPQLEATRI